MYNVPMYPLSIRHPSPGFACASVFIQIAPAPCILAEISTVVLDSVNWVEVTVNQTVKRGYQVGGWMDGYRGNQVIIVTGLIWWLLDQLPQTVDPSMITGLLP
ncbi:hypothetical protein ABZP36_001309 [Zizania latifolia]